MSPDAPLPSLPTYDKPAERKPAVLPESVSEVKPHGIINKIISRLLPGKLKAGMPKLKSKITAGKPTKNKHKVKFK